VIHRVVTDGFYASSKSDIDTAGAQRRSVPNLREWPGQMSTDTPLGLFELTDLKVTDQIALANETRVLVAQHGAGLTNMVFMRPVGGVVEIHPPLPDEAVDTFAVLARACGHTYVRVPQPHVHGDVDLRALTQAVSRYH